MACDNCCMCCGCCKCFCNFIWVIFIGWELFIFWCLFGLLYCVTIVGISCGKQCFKIACYAICPFGKKLTQDPSDKGCCGCFGNIIWIILGGFEIALLEIIFGIVTFCTIVGIPMALKLFSLVKITFCPYGIAVTSDGEGETVTKTEKVETVEVYTTERAKA